MNEDALYIKQFLDGDGKGFEMLVRKYQGRVLGIVHSLIGSDRESEDIVQEVFLKVYYGLKNFKYNAQFSTWLYRMTVNMAYSFLRKRKGFVRDDAVIEDIPADSVSPSDVLLTKERDMNFRKALGKVPAKFKAAMVLKDIEGLSYSEIAGILQCSIGTVESKIYRARQFLKEELFKVEGETI